MPLFEYMCSNCDKIFDSLEKKDVSEKPCPECGTLSPKVMSLANWEINGPCFNPYPPKLIPQEETEKKEFKGRIFVDLECPNCNEYYEDMSIYRESEITEKCEKCGTTLKRVFGFASVKIAYDPKRHVFDPDGNRSQYWNAVKEERRKGNKVKGAHEV